MYMFQQRGFEDIPKDDIDDWEELDKDEEQADKESEQQLAHVYCFSRNWTFLEFELVCSSTKGNAHGEETKTVHC